MAPCGTGHLQGHIHFSAGMGEEEDALRTVVGWGLARGGTTFLRAGALVLPAGTRTFVPASLFCALFLQLGFPAVFCMSATMSLSPAE